MDRFRKKTGFCIGFKNLKGALHSLKKNVIQNTHCVYYYILKNGDFFKAI